MESLIIKNNDDTEKNKNLKRMKNSNIIMKKQRKKHMSRITCFIQIMSVTCKVTRILFSPLFNNIMMQAAVSQSGFDNATQN